MIFSNNCNKYLYIKLDKRISNLNIQLQTINLNELDCTQQRRQFAFVAWR